MSDIINRKLQKEIETLINIIQLWLPVLNQMKSMHHNLEALPNDLVLLRQQLNYLTQIEDITATQPDKNNTTPDQTTASNPKTNFNQIKTVQEKLQKLITNLDGTFPQLLILERKISNLVALKEKLEALKEHNQPQTSLPNYEAEFSFVCQQKNYLSSPPVKKVTTKPKPPLTKKTPDVSHTNSRPNWSLALTLGVGAMVTFSIVNMAAATAQRESELNQRIIELETRIEQLQQFNRRE